MTVGLYKKFNSHLMIRYFFIHKAHSESVDNDIEGRVSSSATGIVCMLEILCCDNCVLLVMIWAVYTYDNIGDKMKSVPIKIMLCATIIAWAFPARAQQINSKLITYDKPVSGITRKNSTSNYASSSSKHLKLEAGNVTMPAFFGDNMVLQRGKPVKFWGTATPGYLFEIEFAGIVKKVVADTSGEWVITFPAKKAGFVTTINVRCDHSFSFKNIIMGDVWICSGQSNMDFSFGKTDSVFNDYNEQPNIRNVNIPSAISNYPQSSVYKTAWTTCNKQSMLNYSAVAYYFAQKLYAQTKIPIGIIHSSWGGTSIKAWISEQTIADIAPYKILLNDFLKARNTRHAIDSIAYRNNVLIKANNAVIANKDEGYINQFFTGTKGVQSWEFLNLPGTLHTEKLLGFKGVLWIRKEIELPESVKNQLFTIRYGQIVGAEDMWVNGIKIGANGWNKSDNLFYPPVNTLRPGKNVFVVRIDDKEGNATFAAKPDEMKIQSAFDKEIHYAIDGDWEVKATLPQADLEKFVTRLEPAPPNTTLTSIYNVKINPLTPLPITGFLWYQGENDVTVAAFYKSLLQALIKDWRQKFKQGNLPFIIAQLPLLNNPPDYNGWVEIREAQLAALQLPSTAMAVTLDAGTPNDIHPHNKKPVGDRLANSALQLVYHQKNIALCPLMESFVVKEDGWHIRFKQTGSGLKANGANVLKGFTISGADQHFIPAEGRIVSRKEIIIYTNALKDCKAVRYAWLPNPADANLYNNEGMPASPFRTDTWTLKTAGKVDDKN